MAQRPDPLPPQAQAQTQANQPQGRTRSVGLRNDSGGIRFIPTENGEYRELRPGEAEMMTLPISIVEMLERDVLISERRGVHNILRIVSRDEVAAAKEGRGPRPAITQPTIGQRANALAADADKMDEALFMAQAQELLGVRWPGGSPDKQEVIALLRN